MEKTEERARPRTAPAGRRQLGLRLVPIVGLLLALDLLFLPWHDFTIDLRGLPVDVEDVLTLERTAVQSPNAGLGIFALALTLALVAYVAIDSVLGARTSASSRVRRDRFPLVAGPLVLVVLVGKLVLEPQFLGLGAWAGALLAAALAYAGFALGQEALTAPVTRAPAAGRAAPATRPEISQQQRRWLFLITVIVVSSVAILWQGDKAEQLTAPTAPATSVAPTTSALPAPSSTAEAPPTTATEASPDTSSPADPAGSTTPPEGRPTTVDPAVAETGSTVTVSAGGVPAGRSFVLKLSRQAAGCGASPTRLGAATNSAEDGTIGPVDAVIPTNTNVGRHFVCFAEIDDPSTSTEPVELIVV